MKATWKDFFTFSRRERGGILVMLTILLGLILLRPLIPRFAGHDERDMEEFLRQARAFNRELEKMDSLAAIPRKEKVEPGRKDSVLVSFLEQPFSIDPNRLTEEQWLATGLDPFVARNILRYREKGGKFRHPGDLEKIYGMDKKWIAAVQSYIVIPKEDSWQDEGNYTVVEKERVSQEELFQGDIEKMPLHIELNSADSAALDSLSGIGPAFAKKIIAYKELLGGYYDPVQLLEVKGMDTARYQQLRHQVWADTSLVRRIDINTVTFKELLRHPYFEYYLVKAIINFRDKKKKLGSVNELRALPEMYPELFNKISYYLEVK